MKSFRFGNPHTDSWKLSLDDISVEEDVIALGGELRVGFFRAETPMCIAPSVIAQFAAQVRELDRTLTGSATLESRNSQSAVQFTLVVDGLGHLCVTGTYEINGNTLKFSFGSDQTQLAPLARWLESAVTEYESHTGGYSHGQ